MNKIKELDVDKNSALMDIYVIMNNVRINRLEMLFFDYLMHCGIKEDEPQTYTLTDLHNAITTFPIEKIAQGETCCIYIKGEVQGTLEMITGHSITQCFKTIKKEYKELKKLGIDRFMYPFCSEEHIIDKRTLMLLT